MKICDKCNKENPQDAKFCMYCGEKLRNLIIIGEIPLPEKEKELIMSDVTLK